jgi:hypothetical protein
MKNFKIKSFLILFFIISGVLNSQIPCSSGFEGNGVDDYITIPNTDAINLQDTRDRTVEFWFNTSDVTSRQIIYEEGAQVNAILLYIEDERIYLGAYRSSAGSSSNRRFFRSDNIIEADNWYHVAFTIEDTSPPNLTFKWFLNGVEQDDQNGFQVDSHLGEISFARNGSELLFPSSTTSGWTGSSIGGSASETYSGLFTSSTNPFNYSGNIALFRIWNVARTESEIDTNKSILLSSGSDLVAFLNEDKINFQANGKTSISSSALITGSDTYTTIPNTDAINLRNVRDRTIEFKFNASDITTRQVLYEEGGGVNAITFFIEDGRVYMGAYRFNANNPNNRQFFRSYLGAISINQWHHIALTLEDTVIPNLTLKWYLDGFLQDSQNGMQVNTHSGDINIGRGDGGIRFPNSLLAGWTLSSVPAATPATTPQTYQAPTSVDTNINNFTGRIDLFRVWNVARTDIEIDTNKDDFLISGTSLVAYQDGTQIRYQPNGGSSITNVINETGIFTWDGGASGNWADTSNWSGGSVPDASRKQIVTIVSSNKPELTSEISVGNLTINTGAEIVVKNGATLNIHYEFINNGTITVEDGGSLIYHNCNREIVGTGTFDIQKTTPTYTGSKFYSYWTSPLVEADSSPSSIFPDASLIYYFDSNTGGIGTGADWASNGTSNLKPGIGYAIRNENTGGESRNFLGKINEGSVVVDAYFNPNLASTDPTNVWSTEGDNLVGNPYSSAIDWDKVIKDTDNEDIEGTIYYWSQNTAEVGDNNVSDYKQYNITGGASNTATGNIASGQGFFIRTTANTSLTFKTTHQIDANNDVLYRGKVSANKKKQNRSWFKFTRGTKVNTLLVGFLKGASNQFDRLYDAPFDITQESLGFYSLVKKKHKASIQGLPPLKREKRVVKLGFAVDEIGEHTIAVQEEHIDSDYYIYLRDREKKITVDLRQRSYTFDIDSVGENNTRFKIIYTKKKRKATTSSKEVNPIVTELDSGDFSVYVDEIKDLIIEYDYDEDNIKQAFLYDISGKKIKSFNGKSSLNVSELKTGIYIVKALLLDNRKLIKKIVIAN